MTDFNQEQKKLRDCVEDAPKLFADNLDPVPKQCDDDGEDSKRRVSGQADLGFLDNAVDQKTGIGASGLCDPIQTGQIVNDIKSPNRNTVYRYSRALRGADEGVMDLFRNLVVIDEDGKAFPVPIIWGTQERAVAAILQDNVRDDNTLVVDRIKLPMLAIHSNEPQFAANRYTYHKAVDYLRRLRDDHKPGFTTQEKYERDTVFGVTRGVPVDITYTLYAWTLYVEDMNQIVEQILLKFSPQAYIRVRGVTWEIPVRLDSTASNLDTEPGDQAKRVIKFQFNLTAETYIPQPIIRKKAVLKTKTDIFDNVEEENITEVLSRLEEQIEAFEE